MPGKHGDLARKKEKHLAHNGVRKPHVNNHNRFHGTDFSQLIEGVSESGHDFTRHIRNIRRLAVADHTILRRISKPNRQSIEDITEELYDIQRLYHTMLGRTSELAYKLQDTFLEEECMCLRQQMDKLSKQSTDSEAVYPQEREMVSKIVRIVNKRDARLADLHIEQMRQSEEKNQLEKEYHKWKRDWMRMFHLTPSNRKQTPKKTNLFSFRSVEAKFMKVIKERKAA